MNLKHIRALMKREEFQEAFSQVEEALKHNKECPGLWNVRGDLIQLLEAASAPPLAEAAKSYRRALKLDSRCLSKLFRNVPIIT
jgi:Tfp pilus assembly protein PilF